MQKNNLLKRSCLSGHEFLYFNSRKCTEELLVYRCSVITNSLHQDHTHHALPHWKETKTVMMKGLKASSVLTKSQLWKHTEKPKTITVIRQRRLWRPDFCEGLAGERWTEHGVREEDESSKKSSHLWSARQSGWAAVLELRPCLKVKERDTQQPELTYWQQT